MRKQFERASVKACNLIYSLKDKAKRVLVSEEGDISYSLSLALFFVIALVFGYPIFKSIFLTVFSDVNEWWKTDGSAMVK